MPFFVKSAYTIKEAQKNLSAVVRHAERGGLATLTRHHKAVAHIISAERLAAIAETRPLRCRRYSGPAELDAREGG